MDRQRRIEIYRQTLEIVRKNGYEINGRRIMLPQEDSERMQQGTVFYNKEFHVNVPTIVGHTEVRVVNEDCLVAAKKLNDEGYLVAVLNMASRRNPGGGVTGGSGAQEENLFRRSNYFLSLYQFAPYAEEYGIRRSAHQYPLDRNFGGIYTPNATVFRDTEAAAYHLLEQPYQVSFIAVPALNRPALDRDGLIVRELIEPFKNKMRTLFRIGLQHGHDALVLGAWGCGAFHCPPRHVARLFHEVMMESEFKDKYKAITFAIIEDHNSKGVGNYKPFAEEFNGSSR
jgi:uncharacterized protein (TIGR02452 family)